MSGIEMSFIYIIPPMISICLGISLAGIVVYRGRFNFENFLFSLICLLWPLTSFAYLLHRFTVSELQILNIERMVHLMYTFFPLINILYFHKILHIRRPLVSFFCAIAGIAFSFMVFTDFYIYGVYTYTWGYIAKAGPGFYIYLCFAFLALLYVVICILSALKDENNYIVKLKFRYITISFLMAGLLTMLNTPALSGYDLYPLGNFIFIPLVFLAYGVYKYRILEIQQLIHIILYWFVFLAVVIFPNGVIFSFIYPFVVQMEAEILFLTFIFWFFINYFYCVKIELYLNRLFHRKIFDLKKARVKFIENILFLRNIKDLVLEFRQVVKNTLNFEEVEFFISDNNENKFESTTGIGLEIEFDIMDWFANKNHLIERNMVATNPNYLNDREALLKLFDRGSSNFIIPIVQHNVLLGLVFLKDKTNFRQITEPELKFINNIKKFVVIALANSILYQNVSKLKDELEEKTRRLSIENIDRMRAEEVLIESEARYKLLADNVIDTIWVLEIDELRFSYLSPSVEKLLGYSLDEMMACSLDEIFTPKSYELVTKVLHRALDSDINNRGAITLDLEQRRKDGSTVWVEASTHFIRNENDKPVSVIGVARDISERKKADYEKQNLEEKLRQSQKMESIGVLAGGIAHDFNNILMAILGYSQLSLMYIPEENEVARKKIKQIEKASYRARDMVAQILAFSRQNELRKVSIRPGPVVTEALNLLRVSLPSTIELIHEFTDELKPVVADPVQIHQIVINLCTNASHAMEDSGGECRVSLAMETVDSRKAELLSVKPGLYLKLSVTDEGHGMKQDVVGRIFDPYYTTKEVGKGTGMGLAVVHGIVLSHQGGLQVDSTPGKGTAFRVFLPVAPENEKPKKRDDDLDFSGVERILFVDDELELTDFVEEALGGLGYAVTSMRGGVEALDRFVEEPELFDIVITDLTMPKMKGDKLAGEIHRLRPDIPIILCTGYNDSLDEYELKDFGITELLNKPLSINELAKSIRRVLDLKAKEK